MKLKIEEIGDETGVILPEEWVSRLNLHEGVVFLDAELVGGGIHLMPRVRACEEATPANDGG